MEQTVSTSLAGGRAEGPLSRAVRSVGAAATFARLGPNGRPL